MNLRLFGVLVGLFIGLGSPLAKAQGEEALVEIRTIDDVYSSYRERRGTHGILFGLLYENYYPDALISMIDEATYSDMFGDSPVGLTGFEIGYKYNFFLGSLSAIYGYSLGQISDSNIGEERSLEINRNALKLMYVADRIMPEPYVAPYVGVGVWDFGLVERAGDADEFTGQTKIGNSVTIGFLVQLNWIEPFSAREAYMSSGLENTYLDFFMTQLSNTTSEEDPTTRTSFDWGAGLRLEF